ncbi:MAG: hydrogenase maturation nickel metallochaperone HypA [Phycisphaerae bacterium]|nr:hydrogenase maturation nickel metallochaperone HypA [Phycisphaerae bacterium]
MHEMSIAMELLGLIESRLPPDATLEAAQVRIGPMHGVVAEAMQWAWQAAVAEKGWPQARLLIDTPPWQLHCPACGRQWTPQAMDERCDCGHLEARVVGGDEFLLLSIDVVLSPKTATPQAARSKTGAL